jgi:transposase
VATVFEVRDELWEVVEAMIPPVKEPEKQGRRPVPDRVCFNAIVFVLVTGIAWAHLPRELGCSGTTAWRAAARLAGRRGLGALAQGAA